MPKKHVSIHESRNQVHYISPRELTAQQRAVIALREANATTLATQSSRDKAVYTVMVNALETLAYVAAYEQAKKQHDNDTSNPEALEELQLATALLNKRLESEKLKAAINEETVEEFLLSVQIIDKFNLISHFSGVILGVYNLRMLEVLKQVDEKAVISDWPLGAVGDDAAIKVIARLEKKMHTFQTQMNGTSNAMIALMVLGALVGAALVVASQGVLLPVALSTGTALGLFWGGVLTFAVSAATAVAKWVAKTTREQSVTFTVDAKMAWVAHDMAEDLNRLTDLKRVMEQHLESINAFKPPTSQFNDQTAQKVNDVMSELSDLKKKIALIKDTFPETRQAYQAKYEASLSRTHQLLIGFLKDNTHSILSKNWMTTEDKKQILSFLKNIEFMIDRYDAMHGMNVSWGSMDTLLDGDTKGTWVDTVRAFKSDEPFADVETKACLSRFLNDCISHYAMNAGDKKVSVPETKEGLRVLAKLVARFEKLLSGPQVKWLAGVNKNLAQRETGEANSKRLTECQASIDTGIEALNMQLKGGTVAYSTAVQTSAQTRFWHVTKKQKANMSTIAQDTTKESYLKLYAEQLETLQKQFETTISSVKTPEQQVKFEQHGKALRYYGALIAEARSKEDALEYIQSWPQTAQTLSTQINTLFEQSNKFDDETPISALETWFIALNDCYIDLKYINPDLLFVAPEMKTIQEVRALGVQCLTAVIDQKLGEVPEFLAPTQDDLMHDFADAREFYQGIQTSLLKIQDVWCSSPFAEFADEQIKADIDARLENVCHCLDDCTEHEGPESTESPMLSNTLSDSTTSDDGAGAFTPAQRRAMRG